MERLEAQLAQWRTFVAAAPALDGRDAEELEAHLRDEIEQLMAAGLDDDEAFLVAVKRLGSLDELSREFAREHRGRLWKQLVLDGGDEPGGHAGGWRPMLVFAIAAATSIQVARLAAGFPDQAPAWFSRSASLFVLPLLAGWFAWQRRLDARRTAVALAPFAAMALFANLYPFAPDAATQLLVGTHLPVLGWFAVAVPYMDGTLGSHDRRMDFVRFTGEWCIYFVLIALGGGVLIALTVGILLPSGLDPEPIVEWVVPSGAAGAVIVAAWLVESKQRVIENMAPVLTMVFTPLFAVMLAVAVVVHGATSVRSGFDRELVGVLDALMVVVLGLVLYGMSAREAARAPGWMDRIQLVTVACALALDLLVLVAMLARVGELGLTPNRAAALGLNLVLLVNLAETARRAARFVAGQGTQLRIERWQTAYLPVFAAWAGVVVVLLPPAFSFA